MKVPLTPWGAAPCSFAHICLCPAGSSPCSPSFSTRTPCALLPLPTAPLMPPLAAPVAAPGAGSGVPHVCRRLPDPHPWRRRQLGGAEVDSSGRVCGGAHAGLVGKGAAHLPNWSGLGCAGWAGLQRRALVHNPRSHMACWRHPPPPIFMRQALVLRNQLLLWTASIGFELCELSFRVGSCGASRVVLCHFESALAAPLHQDRAAGSSSSPLLVYCPWHRFTPRARLPCGRAPAPQHLLPNFNECWWDSFLLDVAICNFLGKRCMHE
jgi:hypothetical protein